MFCQPADKQKWLGKRKIVKFIFIFMAWLCFRHRRRLPRPCACAWPPYFSFLVFYFLLFIFYFHHSTFLVSWQHFSFAGFRLAVRLNVCTFLFAILKVFCALCWNPLGPFSFCIPRHTFICKCMCVLAQFNCSGSSLCDVCVIFGPLYEHFFEPFFFWFIGPTVFHIGTNFPFALFPRFAGQQMFAVLLVNLKCIKWATTHRKRCRVAVFHSGLRSVFRKLFYRLQDTQNVELCEFRWLNTSNIFRWVLYFKAMKV